jgi:hypothetical protein
MTTITATYSPDDNKLRLYASTRLDSDTYARVRAVGFAWAPKQEVFVAPAWTPAREDLCIELAGEIDDEDRSLMDRAEDRAERFRDYSEARHAESVKASGVVDQLADGMNGQPILVGHHSEKRHRRQIERMHNLMHTAAQAWRTGEYWKQRAAAAVAAAKHKERPDVRARRIRTIEAAQRKTIKQLASNAAQVQLWTKVQTANDPDSAGKLAMMLTATFYARHTFGQHGEMLVGTALERGIATPQEVAAIALPMFATSTATLERWRDHYARRLDYERAMLEADGGIEADRNKPQVGGAVHCWCSPRGGFSYVKKVNKISVTVEDNWGNGGANFTRTIPFDKISHVLSAAEVQRLRAAGRITQDAKGTGFRVTPIENQEGVGQKGAPQ